MSQAQEDKWRIVHTRQGGRCFMHGCFKPMTQLAHCLPQDRLHYRIYGKAIIDHPSNVRGACDLWHNKRAQINHRGHPLAADRHAAWVQSNIDKENQ